MYPRISGFNKNDLRGVLPLQRLRLPPPGSAFSPQFWMIQSKDWSSTEKSQNYNRSCCWDCSTSLINHMILALISHLMLSLHSYMNNWLSDWWQCSTAFTVQRFRAQSGTKSSSSLVATRRRVSYELRRLRPTGRTRNFSYVRTFNRARALALASSLLATCTHAARTARACNAHTVHTSQCCHMWRDRDKVASFRVHNSGIKNNMTEILSVYSAN